VLLSLGLDEADSCARIYVFIYSRESFLKVRTKLVKRGIKMVFFEDMFYNLPKGFKVNKVGKTKWIYTIGMVPINEIDLKEEKPIEIKMQKIRKWATCPAKLMFCYVDDEGKYSPLIQLVRHINENYYRVEDGYDRILRAKELGIDNILANVIFIWSYDA